ncbi:MAG: O-antigen ligase family protein [Deltaproteobacteria bacterium]|nr:O-antigen ligase family protein [Deltaproteobacteria bacterium]
MEQTEKKKFGEEKLVDSLLYQKLLQASDSLPLFFLILAILFEYLRPQNTFAPLGGIKAPFIINILSFLVIIPYLARGWNRPNVVMVAFLVYNALYIILGRFIVDSWVVNDGRALFAWIALMFAYLSIALGLSKLCLFKKPLMSIAKVFSLTAGLLGVYAITHGGKGPGGWIGDENDCCFAILTLFPFCLFVLSQSRSFLLKTFSLTLLCFSLGGIVASFSRGGFLSLIISAAFLFWQSPYKIRFFMAALFVVCAAIPFVPDKYWLEISTITQTKSGTAQQRREYWAAATKVWLYQSNVIFGVGPNNAPYWMDNFQEDKITRPSFAGRQVHSTYLQLLADLGLIGLTFFIFTIGAAFWRSIVIFKNSSRLFFALARDSEESIALSEELRFVRYYAMAINAAFVGGLFAALFVSVLYYPPLWVLMGLAAGLESYYGQVQTLISRHLIKP